MKNTYKIKLLLVEDEIAHANLIEVFLTASTLIETNLTKVKSLKECLNALINDSYDVILLDLNLRDSHGLETLDRLLEASPNASVVVLANNNDKNIFIKAIQKGAQDVLYKDHLDTATLTKAILFAHERKKMMVNG